MNEILDDERLTSLIRRAYHDVHLARPLPEAAPAAGGWRGSRLAFAVAAAVLVVIVGAFLAGGRGGEGAQHLPQPAAPSPTPSTVVGGKPPRPTSTATTDDGKCADYARPATLPPLRFATTAGNLSDAGYLGTPQPGGKIKIRVYASEHDAVFCWLYADQVTVDGSATAVQEPAFPVGELSYVAFAEGHVLTQVAFGRAPAGTTKVELFAPGGAPMTATLDGEWYLITRTGDQADRLSEVTKVVAHTPTGDRTLPVRHG
jgi:hypothetical protein